MKATFLIQLSGIKWGIKIFPPNKGVLNIDGYSDYKSRHRDRCHSPNSADQGGSGVDKGTRSEEGVIYGNLEKLLFPENSFEETWENLKHSP